MRISIIVAMSENRVIGIENTLPWHLPADLKHFKSLTMGKPIVMGRKTYESIGRPLPGRTNIVISRDSGYRAEGVTVVRTPEAALQAAGDVEEVMIIGGASFYRQMLPQTDRLYLTLVHQTIDGDAWFPELDDSQWQPLSREDHSPDGKNPWPYSFITMQRIAKA